MNDTTIAPRPRVTLADKEVLKPVFGSLWLPYAILALTVAAFYWNVPAKLAARLKSKPVPQTSLIPTSVNYPMPPQSQWFTNPDDALVARR